MITINTENTRYFKRDPVTMKWDLSAYDDVLLGTRYPRPVFDKFFARVETIPIPPLYGCCPCKTKSTMFEECENYLKNIKLQTEDENNRLKQAGIVWEYKLADFMKHGHDYARHTFLQLNIHGSNQSGIPASLGNPLMPNKF